MKMANETIYDTFMVSNENDEEEGDSFSDHSFLKLKENSLDSLQRLHFNLGRLDNNNVRRILVEITNVCNLGLDLNGYRFGGTALHRLVDRPDVNMETTLAVLTKLHEQGVDLNARTRYGHGWTVLHCLVDRVNMANLEGTLAVITKLHKFGANLNIKARNGSGGTALQWLVKRIQLRNIEVSTVGLIVLTKLCELGADINVRHRNRNGGTVLHQVVYRLNAENLDVTRILLTVLCRLGANPNARDRYGGTILHSLIARPDENVEATMDVLTILCNEGADVNGQERAGYGMTIAQLLLRRWYQNQEAALTVLSKLHELGASMSIQDRGGWTILHHLLHKPADEEEVGRLEATLVILTKLVNEFGVDPNAQSQCTAMHWLIKRLGRHTQETTLSVLTRLFELGANPNVHDTDGRTPLHWLVKRLQLEKIETILTVLTMLYDHGADPNVQDRDGMTPLHSLVDRLNMKNKEVSRQVLTKLCVLGVNPNVLDERGQTVLHTLTKKSVTSFFDTSGMVFPGAADLNIRDESEEETVLGAEDVSKLMFTLLCHGADHTIADNNGNVPLYYALRPEAFDFTTVFVLIRHTIRAGF